MSFESEEMDMFGHRKLGGIGDKVASALKEYSPRYNNGRRIDVVSQRLGYLVRSGIPMRSIQSCRWLSAISRST